MHTIHNQWVHLGTLAILRKVLGEAGCGKIKNLPGKITSFISYLNI